MHCNTTNQGESAPQMPLSNKPETVWVWQGGMLTASWGATGCHWWQIRRANYVCVKAEPMASLAWPWRRGLLTS